jgi:hypothetical protein
VAQIEANSFHVAVLERVLVDRRPVQAEVAGSIDVGATVVGHRKKHHAVAVNVSGFDEGLLVGFPDAVDDRRLARISGGAMIEFAAQVDHSHDLSLPFICGTADEHRVVADYSRRSDEARP